MTNFLLKFRLVLTFLLKFLLILSFHLKFRLVLAFLLKFRLILAFPLKFDFFSLEITTNFNFLREISTRVKFSSEISINFPPSKFLLIISPFWNYRVLENPTFLRDPALLFFLQSDRTVQEMLDMRKSSSIRISSCAVQITSSTGSDTVSPLLRSEDDESSSQGDDEEEENVDLTLNPVAKPSILSTSPSESSDLGKFGLLRDVGKAQPIPVPYRKNNKKIEDSDRYLQNF